MSLEQLEQAVKDTQKAHRDAVHDWELLKRLSVLEYDPEDKLIAYIWKAVAKKGGNSFDDHKYYGTTKYYTSRPRKRDELHWGYAWDIERIPLDLHNESDVALLMQTNSVPEGQFRPPCMHHNNGC